MPQVILGYFYASSLLGFFRLLVQDPLYRWAYCLICAVNAAYPAAGTALALCEFGVSALDATIAGIDKLGVFNPANPLVSCEWCDVVPGY